LTQNQRFCPNCGSTNVEFDTDHTNVIGDIIANQNQWLCNECGYRGLMPQLSQDEKDGSEQQPEGLMRPEGDPEELEKGIEEEDSQVEFDPVEQETVDTAFGKAYFKYFMYISLPITVLYILFRLLL